MFYMKIFILFNLFFYFVYSFLMGFMTVLESKIVALIQLSSSMNSIGFMNVYHFFLDFLKMMGKGLFVVSVSKIVFFLSFLLFMFLLVLSFFFIPLNCFSLVLFYGFFLYLFLDGGLVFLKMLVSNLFNFKFVSFSFYKMKSLYVFMEILFIFIYFKIFYFFSFFGLNFFYEMLGLSFYFLEVWFLFFYLFLFFIFLILFKFFSVPFDYIEIESEFVGGVILEFYGVLFLLWSLIEYMMILNSVIFMVFILIFFLLFKNMFVLMIGMVLSLIGVFFSSGVLLSVSFFSSFYFLSKVYVMLIFCLIYLVVVFLF